VGKARVSKKDLITAAGGILWRWLDGEWQVVMIHRCRYDDWSLPKGKLEEGEDWQTAAVREVAEETGYQVQMGGFAGALSYTTERGPKVVRFWHMLAQGEPAQFMEDEVSEVVWLGRSAALERMQYPLERALLEAWLAPDQPAV